MEKTNQGIGIGQTLYQDAASLGRFKALVVLIIGLCISILLCLIGIYIIIKDRKYTSSYAKITQIIGCIKKSSLYNCKIAIEYTIENKKYEKSDVSLSTDHPLSIGESLMIYYDPSNPSDISIESTSGWILIGISIFIALSCYLTYWLSNRYTIFAAAEGTSTIASLFRR